MDLEILYILVPLLCAWLVDRLLGDPVALPHLIVGFGKAIAWGEKLWNKGRDKLLKGGVFSILLIAFSFAIVHYLLLLANGIHPLLGSTISALFIFYCLAGKTLIVEVRQVFVAVDISLEAGRAQVARIVGRDTSNLTAQQIRTAALETLSENLSDGVIAPLFWYAVLGVPGMVAYKMINTLDSMIGYKSDRYKDFGCWAAKIDDVANYIPARLTALLMLIVSGSISKLSFVLKNGKKHASPNSGYPESALVAILDCQFGGNNIYHNVLVEKPLIGTNDRALTYNDVRIATKVNQRSEVLMILLVALSIICL